MLAHQLRGLGEFFEPYADEIDALRAEVEALRAKIKDHNDDCQAACGHGDQEAVNCGYRSYFEKSGRRCPNCPMYDVIEIDGA